MCTVLNCDYAFLCKMFHDCDCLKFWFSEDNLGFLGYAKKKLEENRGKTLKTLGKGAAKRKNKK